MIGIVKVQMRVPSVDIQQLKEMIKLDFKMQLVSKLEFETIFCAHLSVKGFVNHQGILLRNSVKKELYIAE